MSWHLLLGRGHSGARTHKHQEYVQYTTLETRYPRYGNSVSHEIKTYHSIWRVQQPKPSHHFWFFDDWTCFFVAWETEQAVESWWYSCQCWLLSQCLSKSYSETLWQPFLWQVRGCVFECRHAPFQSWEVELTIGWPPASRQSINKTLLSLLYRSEILPSMQRITSDQRLSALFPLLYSRPPSPNNGVQLVVPSPSIPSSSSESLAGSSRILHDSQIVLKSANYRLVEYIPNPQWWLSFVFDLAHRLRSNRLFAMFHDIGQIKIRGGIFNQNIYNPNNRK